MALATGAPQHTPHCDPLSVNGTNIFMECGASSTTVTGYCNHDDADVDLATECAAVSNDTTSGMWVDLEDCGNVVADDSGLWLPYNGYEYRLFDDVMTTYDDGDSLCSQHSASLFYLTMSNQNISAL